MSLSAFFGGDADVWYQYFHRRTRTRPFFFDTQKPLIATPYAQHLSGASLSDRAFSHSSWHDGRWLV
ncbi:copper resistance D domain protein [Yersinia enterocolitica]|nr:copper resistance D domain protein [Yersinia enterocolitica]